MHKMPDFDFYTNTYLGVAIPEKEFPMLAAKAAGILESYERSFRVTGGQTERAMALCAMCDCLHTYNRNRHTAATLGSLSVRYEKPRQSLQRSLYQAAATYLDFYRGVG